MRVLLLQLDGKIPNLALMRIARHWSELGATVELRQVRHMNGIHDGAFDQRADKVYASLIFEKSKPLARELLRIRPDAIVGGTGWNLTTTLEDHGIDGDAKPDYSIYPNFRQSMGFSQRGCRLNCGFCVVGRKEGKVRDVAGIGDIWRGDPHPREVLLLDNDFFGQESWPRKIEEMRSGRFKVSFNQGINARFLTPETAAAIASVDYRADDMKERRLYTAWDNRKDEPTLMRGLGYLKEAGVRPDDIMVYVLIGYNVASEADWIYRVQTLSAFGARPYPMPFNRTPLEIGFQRWCVSRAYKKVSWDDYKAAKCRPEKLRRQPQRMALELFN